MINKLNLSKYRFLAKTIMILAVMLTGGANFVWGDTVTESFEYATDGKTAISINTGNKSLTNDWFVIGEDLIYPSNTWSGYNIRLQTNNSRSGNCIFFKNTNTSWIVCPVQVSGTLSFYTRRYSSNGYVTVGIASKNGDNFYISNDNFQTTSFDTDTYKDQYGEISVILGNSPVYVAFLVKDGFLDDVTYSPYEDAGGSSTCTSVDAPTGLECSEQSKTSLTFSWTAAENASSYDVTLYSDAECTTPVTTGIVNTTTYEFTGLNSSQTYYCKVQSKGDGATYCEEGNVTGPISGTTLNKDYILTMASNNVGYGTASALAYSMDEGETTTITAVANSGYKFRYWTVEGTGATVSSTTENPTTLTIGTANTTVTATFSALNQYTITYNKGDCGEGSDIDNGEKTEDEDFTLSSSTYNRSGYIQTGWALSDGGDKAYELGDTYTDNANLDIYPYWTELHTITYDRNGGTNYMTGTTGAGEVTLKENSFIKSGYTFLGWATSQDDANAGIVSYADKAIYLITADVTLYAVWGENYCEMKPVTSGTAPNVGNTISMQSEANVFGGKMTVYAATGGLSYSSYGLQSGGGYTATLDIELNNYMKPGSIIVLTIHSLSSGTERGYNLYSSDGNNKIATLTTTNINSTTIQYKVKADDGLDGTKGFKLVKANTNLIYLKSLYVIDCQPGGVIPESGWSTYSCNKALDLSTISGGTAYIATTVNNSENNVIVKTCNNIVEAGTGLMIKGTAGSIFTINTTTEASNLNKTNLLVGLPNGGTAPEGSYVFGWPTGKSEEYGFYYINSTEPTLGLGKAYLTSPIASSNGAKLRISFDDEENTTTDIQNAKELKQQNREFFNLQGQRVLTPKKGLYVSKGKMIFNK